MNANHMDKFNSLFSLIAELNTAEECRDFFEDLCTMKELTEMNQRLEVAKLLSDGKNYQEISKATGASSATISRVNKCLMYSEGYKSAIKKITESK
jgi:TrpR-related protein YerC/YecD